MIYNVELVSGPDVLVAWGQILKSSETLEDINQKVMESGSSLEVQWLRLHAFNAVQSQVRELRSHIPGSLNKE